MDQSLQQELNRENLQLAMPVEVSMMATLERMSFWARTVHELMYESNPQMMITLHENGKLIEYLDNQQTLLNEAARQLEKEYRRNHPLSPTAPHLARAAWLNQAKSYSQEILLAEVSASLSALQEAQQDLRRQ